MGGRVGDHETGQFIFVFLDLQGEQSYREKKKKRQMEHGTRNLIILWSKDKGQWLFSG